jgi:4-hydroxy-tetrahydrodipicolinate synthase
MQTKHDRRMKEYTELAMRGEVEKARKIRDSLEPVRQALRSTRPAGTPQAHQKHWQELLGQAGGPVRRPLLNLTEGEKAATRAVFESCGLRLTAADAARAAA